MDILPVRTREGTPSGCNWPTASVTRDHALFQGASLGNVLKLTWIVEETGGVKVMRPKLVMTEGYAKAHNLQIAKYRPGIDPEPLHAEEINFAKIAIRCAWLNRLLL